MTQIIEIEGDLARRVSREVIQEMPLADILPFIENRPPITMFHPRSAIFTYWNESDPRNKQVKYLCELPPGIRSIVKSGRRYRLAIPWTYFVFGFTMGAAGDINDGANWQMVDYLVFHSRDRFEGPEHRLWTAFLPNVYEDGRICFGTTGVPTRQSLMNRVDQMVNEWYLTQFNNDVHGSRTHPLPFNGRLPNGWALWVNATRDHGLQAIQQMPEWDVTDQSIPSWTVSEILTGMGARPSMIAFPQERVQIGTVTDAVPAIQMPWTFGRIEEWYAQLDPVQRFRVRTAANNYVTENPAAVQAPTPDDDPNNLTDDGGEAVNEQEV